MIRFVELRKVEPDLPETVALAHLVGGHRPHREHGGAGEHGVLTVEAHRMIDPRAVDQRAVGGTGVGRDHDAAGLDVEREVVGRERRVIDHQLAPGVATERVPPGREADRPTGDRSGGDDDVESAQWIVAELRHCDQVTRHRSSQDRSAKPLDSSGCRVS